MRATLVFIMVTLVGSVAVAQEDTSSVNIENVRIVLSKKGQTVSVEQIFHLSPKSESVAEVSKFQIPLPSNALNPQLLMSDEKGIQILSKILVVSGEIPADGRSVSAKYELPIVKGSMSLEQNLKMNIGTLQVISTWTIGNTSLKVAGLGEARTHAMNSLNVLVATGMDLKDGTIRIRLSGLGEGFTPWMRIISVTLGVLSLCLGLIMWLRKRNKNA